MSGERQAKWLGVPAPPEALRRGPYQVTWSSPIHSTKLAAKLGVLLGISFTVCFITGLVSHAYQQGLNLPSSPVWLYQVNQGVHVITGLVSVPLLLGKLAVVYPRFWVWPPVKDVLHGLERLSLLFLVGGAIFQLTSGIFNIAGWYLFGFFFTPVHYWVAWITIGALGIHIFTKLPLIREGLKGERDALAEDLEEEK